MIARTLTQHLSRKGFDIHDKQVAAIIEECDFYITQKYIFESQEQQLSKNVTFISHRNISLNVKKSHYHKRPSTH